jgi:hypothetical protein
MRSPAAYLLLSTNGSIVAAAKNFDKNDFQSNCFLKKITSVDGDASDLSIQWERWIYPLTGIKTLFMLFLNTAMYIYDCQVAKKCSYAYETLFLCK